MFRYAPLAAAIAAAHTFSSQAQTPTSSDPVRVDPVYVIADTDREDTPNARQQKERFLRRPGAETIVNTQTWQDKKISNFEDAFALTPGIHSFARGDSTGGLYSIRGSDIATEGPRNGRGIRAYQDGVPLGRTEAGITNALMDMLAADYVEVYRGPNSLRFGALATGGAINFVSKTGKTFVGHAARLSAGSFNFRQAQYEFGYDQKPHDVYVSFSHSHTDGYRRHDVAEYVRTTGNWGWDLGNGLSNRVYLNLGRTRDELSGTLPLKTYLQDPRAPGQYSVEFDTDANFEYARLGNRLVQRLGPKQRLEYDAYLMWIRFDHLPTPFSGIVDRTWVEHGLGLRYAGVHQLGAYETEFVGGLRYNGSRADFLNWQHRNGGQNKGPQTLDARFANTLYEGYGEAAIKLDPYLRTFLGLQWAKGKRDYQEYALPSVPSCGPVVGTPPPFCQALGNQRPQPGTTTPRSRLTEFDTINPKLGLNWEFIPKRWFAFASVARSFEAPTDADVSNAAADPTTQIKPQRALTYEGGIRGGDQQFSFDLTAYRMHIRHEILSKCRPGIPNCAQNIAFNADRTLHQGIELGFGAQLLSGILNRDDRLRIDGVWNYADMRFDNDRTFGNNRLPVIPRHTLHLEAKYQMEQGWHVGANLHHVGSRTYTYDGSGGPDFIIPGYTIWGLRFGYAPEGRSWRIVLEGRNLADKAYVAQYTPVPTRGTRTTPDIRPGVGRAWYLHLSAEF